MQTKGQNIGTFEWGWSLGKFGDGGRNGKLVERLEGHEYTI